MKCLFIAACLLCNSCISGIILPVTKTDGSLDASSLLSHIALLEQSIQNKASAAEMSQLKSDLSAAQKELAATKSKLDTTTETLQTELKDVKDDLKNAEIEIAVLKNQLQSKGNTGHPGSSQMMPNMTDLTYDVSHLKADVFQVTTVVSDLRTEVSQLQSLCNQTGNQNNVASLSYDVSHLKTDVTHLTSDVSDLKTEVLQLQSLCNKTGKQDTVQDMSHLTNEVSQLKTDVIQLQFLQNQTGNQGNMTGATFTRWGRTSCPADSSIVYKGYPGGLKYGDKASGSNTLCLPDQPLYANHTTTRHDSLSIQGSHIYGSIYRTNYDGSPFRSLRMKDMPCVVCEIQSRNSVMMVAARDQCYPGWTREYKGYLMGPGWESSAGEYICVDAAAEALPGSDESEYTYMYAHVLHPVEGSCGPLPCPPYQDGWELTCAVCSK